MSAQELIVQVKKLQPTDVEMMFCLGIMLWHFNCKHTLDLINPLILVDLAAKLSPSTLQIGERMVDTLYNELAIYYVQVFQVDNSVKRVAELMRLLATVEVSKPFDSLLEYL